MEHLVKLIDPSNVPLAVLLALCFGQYKMIVDLMKARDEDRKIANDTLVKLSEAMNGLTNAVQRLETISIVHGK